MKHLTITICAVLLSVGLFAQEEVNMLSKRGEMILPQQGEMALGIDALPILGYFGNLFNGTVGNNASFGFINGLYNANNIYVKYYLQDQVAIRGAVRNGLVNSTNREFVTMDQQIMDPLMEVTDKRVINATNIGVGADYLMYRGKGRVQGYYGGGAFVNYNTSKTTFTYGNPITTEFSSPTWFGFTTNTQVTGGQRTLENFNNTSLGVTLRGVIGVEYFFAPKISVGGEMGLGFNTFKNGGFTTVERWNGTDIEVETTEDAHDGALGIDNFTSGALFIMFHF
ncbi:MAG: hypothetical protein PHE33_01845 [Bacteroidales bacterium]|nr:hypothetical protein [Bacteroidales bacterium]